MNMSETNYCFVSTMACNPQCDLLHDATGQCKIVMLINRLLGDIDGPVKQVDTPQSPLVANAMSPDQLPDMSKIEWLIKGNKDARDTDSFAYAFVFTYDQGTKSSTDKLRPDAVELYNYLKAHDNTLTLDGFVYSLNKTETLFARNKARD